MTAEPATAAHIDPLFSPLRLGSLELAHRVVMAPLTRLRSAQPGNVPTPLNAEYYRQRASRGGLIISEATQILPEAQGYPRAPGIHSAEQIDGWRLVTKAVHEEGGLIALQLWHVGRISHPSLQPGGVLPVAPSAVRPAGRAFTPSFERVEFETPRALERSELPGLISAYARAAENAMAAGFDAVEIHAANGYLLDQFLRAGPNVRTDDYGGSIDNRVRLTVEVATAVAAAVGAERTGIRFSPFGRLEDTDDPLPLFGYVIGAVSRLGLAYVHLVEPREEGLSGEDAARFAGRRAGEFFRDVCRAPIIAAGGYTGPDARAAIAAEHADAIAFGRAFISSPDLPERLRRGIEPAAWDASTFYNGAERGYTDYPEAT